MTIRTYTFTGYHGSGNGFLYLFDNTCSAMFCTERDVSLWSKKPVIGDKIETHRDPKTVHHDIVLVKINSEIVFQASEESKKKLDQMQDDYVQNLKKQKGFL